jgi:chondroitin AC lyase
MAVADPKHADEYADWIGRVTGARPPGSSGPRGNRHFWRSDVMVHRPGSFYVSVRMHSERTAPTEVRVNRENLKGYHLSDGVSFLMQRGDEYHDIQPVWDWRKLPGATCRETQEPLPYGRGLPTRGSTAFVGGVSDGQVGVAAMEVDKAGVQARKAWFFLPDGWVALGAGIAGKTDDPLTTSLNQCLFKSDVLLLREGWAEVLAGERWRGKDLEGVHHDGVGYYLLAAQPAVVSAAPQRGAWTEIQERATDTGTVTQDVFSLWIEHGPRPTEGAYTYRVVPRLSADEFVTYPDQNPVSILANSAHLQAVLSSGNALAQAVFYAPGRLELDKSLTIEADIPCLLMLRQTAEGLDLSIADPTQTRRQARIRLTGQYTCRGCTDDTSGGDGETVLTVDLPSGEFAGQSVQQSLIRA